jgi:hypothetical protein
MVACAVVAKEGVSDPEEQVHGRRSGAAGDIAMGAARTG